MLLKNKSLILFIGIGFIATVLIWGFVGGCGTRGLHIKATPPPKEKPYMAEGLILEEDILTTEGIVYLVEPGDTLWEISRRFEVTISAIKEANNLTKDTITVGQRLIIPVQEDRVLETKPRPSAEKTKTKTRITEKPKLRPVYKKAGTEGGLVVYKVRKGDSLWRIAQTHGTTIERIVDLNGVPRGARLKPGQELLVPKEK